MAKFTTPYHLKSWPIFIHNVTNNEINNTQKMHHINISLSLHYIFCFMEPFLLIIVFLLLSEHTLHSIQNSYSSISTISMKSHDRYINVISELTGNLINGPQRSTPILLIAEGRQQEFTHRKLVEHIINRYERDNSLASMEICDNDIYAYSMISCHSIQSCL